MPTLSKCPICGAQGTLEASYGHNRCPAYWCRSPECWFVGDGIQLYRAVTHLSTREACHALIANRVLPYEAELDPEIDEYELELSRYHQDVWSIWELANQQLQQAGSAAAGLLQDFGCWESHNITCGVRGLGRHLGVLRGSQVRELANVPKHVDLNVRAGQHYLVMPLWLDRWVISGFVLFGHDGQQLWWPILGKESGVGMIHTCPMNEGILLGCGNPVHALQFYAHSLSQAQPMAVTYLHDSSATWGYLTASRRVMLNLSRRPALYERALAHPECQIVTEHDLRGGQVDRISSPRARLEHLCGLGLPTHRALAVYLGSLASSSAASVLGQLNLQASDIQRVLAAAPEHTRGQLSALFRQGQSSSSIKFQSDVITCAEQGWKSGRRGVICNTMFFIDEILCDTNTHQGTAVGTVVQGGREFKFTSPIQDLENRTQEWLRNILADNRAGWLEIQPGWASKLFAISQIFRTPKTTYTTNAIGWVEGGKRLVLPNLLVEAGEVVPNPHPIRGASCATGLSRTPLEADKLDRWSRDTPTARCFWALFGVVGCNLFSPFHRFGTFGIGVLDRPQGVLGALTDDLVEQVGLERITFRQSTPARLQDIWKQEQKSPFPLYIDETWAANDGFSKWLSNKQARNCLVRMSRPVAIGTCLDGGWAYVASDAPLTDERSAFAGAWDLLPRFVAWAQLNPIQWPVIRSGTLPALYDALARWMGTVGMDPKVLRGAQEMVEIDMLERTSSWGMKFVSLLIESVESGLIPFIPADQSPPGEAVTVDYAEELVFISRASLTRLMGQMGLAVPSHNHIVSALQSAKALKGTRYRDVAGYSIPLDQWSMLYSLRGTR